MILKWTINAWEDYLSWENDKQTRKKINVLIKDVMRNPFEGLGKPEPLKHQLSGAWSRRIDKVNRLVYMVDDEGIIILSCRYHY